MRYDPDKHRRRSIRLKGYDYAEPGAHFVTVCTRDRESLFGHVVNGEMHLNEAGEIARGKWLHTAQMRPNVELDAFTIMPNHLHGIVVITGPCTGEASVPPDTSGDPLGTHASPLRTAIREYGMGNPARWEEDENNPAFAKG